jgi:hypothetical protein
MVDEDESVDLSFGLKGKVTVVTGSAAGIGAAIARAFVAKGARVALVDRDIDTARAHARNLGENVRAFQCDVADPSSAENAKIVSATHRREPTASAGRVRPASAESPGPPRGIFTLPDFYDGVTKIASDLPAITAAVSQIAQSAGLYGRYCPAAGPVPGGASPVADGSGCGPDSARASGPTSEPAWPAELGPSAVTATGLAGVGAAAPATTGSAWRARNRSRAACASQA